MANVSANIPTPGSPIADPTSGSVTQAWWFWFQSMMTRTGGTVGVDASTVQTTANSAKAAAAAAQTSANEAQSAATAAQTTATAAQSSASGAATAVAAETTARIAAVTAEATARAAADALLAPKLSPTFTGNAPVFALFGTFANDAAAATGGIVVGQLYWNGTTVVQRRV